MYDHWVKWIIDIVIIPLPTFANAISHHKIVTAGSIRSDEIRNVLAKSSVSSCRLDKLQNKLTENFAATLLTLHAFEDHALWRALSFDACIW